MARTEPAASAAPAVASRPAGRQRDPRIDATVLGATLDLLRHTRYSDLSIGQIAQHAGVHRPAIYRRWPTKQHLVADAIASVLGTTPTPDTGDLRRDLIAGITTVANGFNHPVLGHVLLPLVADLGASPELRDEFLTRVFHQRRATTRTTIQHAIDRGEVDPEIDMDFVLDALAAPTYFRALYQHAPVDASLVENTVDLVLAGIQTHRDHGQVKARRQHGRAGRGVSGREDEE
jgi:AcrR family transcriptional regulator